MVIQVDIAPHADNRLLRVSATSNAYAWHAERPLHGSDGPRQCVFDVGQLPAGAYSIEGEVIGASGRARARVTGCVTVGASTSPLVM